MYFAIRVAVASAILRCCQLPLSTALTVDADTPASSARSWIVNLRLFITRIPRLSGLHARATDGTIDCAKYRFHARTVKDFGEDSLPDPELRTNIAARRAQWHNDLKSAQSIVQ